MLNIPIYRAKKQDSNEYVMGFLIQDFYNFKWYLTDTVEQIEIDISTLSISFDNTTWFDMENADMAFREYSKTHGYIGIQQ